VVATLPLASLPSQTHTLSLDALPVVNDIAPLIDRVTGQPMLLPSELHLPPSPSLPDIAPASGLSKPVLAPQNADHAHNIVALAHDYGHFGRQAVTDKVHRMGFTWPDLAKDVRTVSDNCSACQHWTRHRNTYEDLSPVITYHPWQHVQIDFVTSLPPTPAAEDGTVFTVLLVIVDVFTGFLLLCGLLLNFISMWLQVLA
jgi:hypothetical protein